VKDDDVFAFGHRLNFIDALDVHDGRTAHTHKFFGRELFFQRAHRDLRDIVSSLGAQFFIEHINEPFFANLVTRGTSSVPGELGPVTLVIDPNFNLSRAIFEGLDYEPIYILDFVAASFVCHLKSYRGSASSLLSMVLYCAILLANVRSFEMTDF